MKVVFALHVGCIKYSYTLYMKVVLALYVGCIVQLHTLHESRARFTCWAYTAWDHVGNGFEV